ncbi:MmgE/PrpD family protein [Ottowia sp. VDI28]|uniref:MmgE/PrpD family protein n=1 Tax=Ottowia sp. VDI28 TaxID=3133968 RepID=UPI003C2CD35B
MSHVDQLGAYAQGLCAEALPDVVLERMACCLLYNLCLGRAAADPAHPVQHAIRAVCTANGMATLLGGGTRSALDAAAANAAAITLRGQNDTHAAMNGHLGCLVIPAVLALAQEQGADASTFVAALVAGYEVAPRIAEGMAAAAMERGWRGTSLFGIFGVAAACARLLKCDADQIANALSLSANFAGGLVRCYAEGTSEWAVQVAHAARSGLNAALLAHHGMKAASEILEGKGGFYRAIGGATRPISLEGWRSEEVSFKPFPGCAINQVPTAVLLDLLRQEGLRAEQVEDIELHLHPSHAAYPGVERHGPFDSSAAAIMSAPFMLQLALEHGGLLQTDFANRYSADPVHARSKQVRVRADEALAPFECRLGVHLLDGRRFSASSTGTQTLVMGWEQTVALTRGLANENPEAFSETDHERLVLAVRRCVSQRDAKALPDLFAALT